MAEAYPGFCSSCDYCYSPPLKGMLVHRRVTPSSMWPAPIYTPGWRETKWGKVSCLRKQHDDRDWVSIHRPSGLKSNAPTTTPPCPHCRLFKISGYFSLLVLEQFSVIFVNTTIHFFFSSIGKISSTQVQVLVPGLM